MQTASKKVINGWAMYDWANSVYSLVVTSTFFPAYFTAIAPERIEILGRTYNRDSLASYAIALSFLIIAILSPILSSIADYKGNKIAFMKFFCYLGSLACALMFFFTKDNIQFGLFLSIVASIGYCGSIVFYNAYLPEIAAEKDQDRISAKGFALGYTGSVILMILSLVFVTLNDKLNWGLDAWPVRISFLTVGIWWAGFAQLTFSRLPPSKASDQHPEHNIFVNGFYELKKVWQQLTHHPNLKRFLRSFFFYNMGVQTVMLVATIFGEKILHLPTTKLIATILILQLVAIPGAMLMSYLSSKKFGNVNVLIGVVVI